MILRKHQNFIAKHNLNFDLLVDEDFQLSKAIGVYQLKNHLVKNLWVLFAQHLLLMRMALSSMSLKRLK